MAPDGEGRVNRFDDMPTDQLLAKADEAISWGTPDNESVGWRFDEWTMLVAALSKRIRNLTQRQSVIADYAESVLNKWEK